MTITIVKFKRIIDDLKESGYFRVWAFVWLVFFVLGFAVLIILGSISNQATLHPNQVMFVSNVSSMFFPRFHFRTPEQGDGILQITGVSCTAPGGHPLEGADCASWNGGPPPNPFFCQAVLADQVEFFNDYNNREQRIRCNITTSGNNSEVGDMIGFNFEGSNDIFIGPDGFHSAWLFPKSHIDIILGKAEGGYYGPNVNEWTREIIYHSTVSTPGSFSVNLILNDFLVFHMANRNQYNGWRAIGDIGGFAYFLVIIHTAVMIAIGFCFINSASFLKSSGTGAREMHHQSSSAPAYSYSEIKSEN